MRSVVQRYDDLRALAELMEHARGQALPAPDGAKVRDGEWVLAMFEFGDTRRATAAAGRGAILEDGPALVFERRDWDRLRQFATAASSESSARLAAATPAPAEPQRPRPAREAFPGPAVTGRTLAYPSASAELEALTRTESHPPPSMPPEEVAERTPIAPSPSGRSTVLLVDDDPDLRDVVGAMLEAVGLEVEVAATAEDALESLAGRLPNLLLLDWSLPGMSGLEMCRVVRRNAAMVHLPILFLTAHAGTQEMVEAFASGADDYVIKPFRAAELGARIFGLLRRTRAPAKDPG